jgi:hypothetical protein
MSSEVKRHFTGCPGREDVTQFMHGLHAEPGGADNANCRGASRTTYSKSHDK